MGNNSETHPENIFRKFYGAGTFIEKSAIPKEYGFVSKKTANNQGYPDFFKDMGDFCIVVEAKAVKHAKAQDEVKYYMKNNTVNKDILGMAISGQSENNFRVTYYLKVYGDDGVVEADIDDELLTVSNLKKIYHSTKKAEITTVESLTKTLNELNKEFHNENIVRDTDRSLFFSGIMIALKDSTFRNTYKGIQAPSSEEAELNKGKLLEAHLLNEYIIEAIDRQLKNKINNLSKEYNWKDKFSFIRTIDYALIKYKAMITKIEKRVFIPFENDEKQDILGRAYKIFLSKAGKVDNKNIIITPDHIKSLMVRLARLDENSVVLDTCTGTGGFLMEAMEVMLSKVKYNEDKARKIREEKLIGFEVDSVLFALACSNMFLHGDGRTNLIFRSSLIDDEHDNIVNDNPEELFESIRSYEITRVIINPPYESNKPIKFVKQAIDYLEDDGQLVVIMPTPTLVRNQGRLVDGEFQKGLTDTILKNARLDYVIKMPESLFSEQKRTVNTSIFGFTKTAHRKSDEVLFYDLSDDGFVSIQHKGRVDKNGTWNELQERVAKCIETKTEIQGISELRKIYQGDTLNCYGTRQKKNSKYELKQIGELFDVTKGTLASEQNDNNGKYDFITASAEWKKHSEYTFDGEAIVMAVSASGSLGRTHYVNGKCIVANLCIMLTPKKDSTYEVNLQFYNFYFNTIRRQLRNDLADGTSKLTIKPEDLKEYYIEYIPKSEQDIFCEKNIKPFEVLKQQLKNAEKQLTLNLDTMLNI